MRRACETVLLAGIGMVVISTREVWGKVWGWHRGWSSTLA